MLTLRPEHVAAFEQDALRRYEDEMVGHLKGFAGKLCEIRGEPCVRQVIRLGIQRAAQYGFTHRGPVRFFIELMFSFGCDFDTDPQYPWIQGTLRDPELADQTLRAEELYSRWQTFMQHVAGPKKRYTLEALRRLDQAKLEDAQTLFGDFEKRIITGLRKIHPQKTQYVGEPALRVLTAKGIETARGYGVTSELGAAVLVALMFGFGHGVTKDPLYPWVSSTLNDPLVKDPNGRAERLYTKAKIYAAHLLAYLEAEQKNV
jgi:hypothetical protein